MPGTGGEGWGWGCWWVASNNDVGCVRVLWLTEEEPFRGVAAVEVTALLSPPPPLPTQHHPGLWIAGQKTRIQVTLRNDKGDLMYSCTMSLPSGGQFACPKPVLCTIVIFLVTSLC